MNSELFWFYFNISLDKFIMYLETSYEPSHEKRHLSIVQFENIQVLMYNHPVGSWALCLKLPLVPYVV